MSNLGKLVFRDYAHAQELAAEFAKLARGMGSGGIAQVLEYFVNTPIPADAIADVLRKHSYDGMLTSSINEVAAEIAALKTSDWSI